MKNKNAMDQTDGARCGARNRSGNPCRRWPVRGAKRCRLHGGLSLVGLAHPSWKTGRYSKVLQGMDLGAAYERALSDPKLTSVRDELALCDTRQAQLLERLPAGGAFSSENALKALDELQRAIDANDAAAMATAAETLKQQIDAGVRSDQVWQEILPVIEQRRRLAETEVKARSRLKQTLTVEQAMEFAHRVATMIKECLGLVTCAHCKQTFAPREEMGRLTRELTVTVQGERLGGGSVH